MSFLYICDKFNILFKIENDSKLLYRIFGIGWLLWSYPTPSQIWSQFLYKFCRNFKYFPLCDQRHFYFFIDSTKSVRHTQAKCQPTYYMQIHHSQMFYANMFDLYSVMFEERFLHFSFIYKVADINLHPSPWLSFGWQANNIGNL